MKKGVALVIIILVAIISILFGFNTYKKYSPNTYYKIYLGDEYQGMIESLDDLYDYINKNENEIKEQYGVKNVYVPENFISQKVITYDDDLTSIEDMYKLLNEKSSFTISGYEYKIDDDGTTVVVNVLSDDIFKIGIEKVIKTFVGEKEYEDYKSDTQKEIETTGTKFNNIYISGTITYKEKNISVDKKIYTDSDDLASFFLYSEKKDESSYTVKSGDTISSISYDNQISEEEFLMSNPHFSNAYNLLYPGQVVSIVKLNPQIKVVVQEYTVTDMPKKYAVEERHDENKYKGDNEVIQKGENGLERVAQNVTIINGIAVDAVNVSKVELKPAINEIVIKGDKIIPNVGSLYSWLWPTDSGYRITSYFGYRIDPVYGGREGHKGIDIAGLGRGGKIYASNNGTIEKISYDARGYGNYVVINHNNGYWTLYGHMQNWADNLKLGQTVARGQVIGYIGSTGKSTGAHLHFEVHKGCWLCRINPLEVVG